MWPLDRRSSTDILRIGRHSVERWTGSSLSLSLAGSHALSDAGVLAIDSLAAALRMLYASKPEGPITVLLESVWLPVLLIEVGPTLWTRAQVESLLRHRLHLLHGESATSLSGWDLRIDHIPGERFALGYGMPLGLRQSLVETGAALRLQWAALLPAFAWGLDRLRPARRWSARSGWWVWPEQDRLLVAGIASGRVAALNTGAAFSDDPGQIARTVDVECLRSGLPISAEPIVAATWTLARTPANPPDRLRWVSIAGWSQPNAHHVAVASPSSAHP